MPVRYSFHVFFFSRQVTSFLYAMLPSKDVKKGIKSKRMGHNTTPVPGFVRREKTSAANCRDICWLCFWSHKEMIHWLIDDLKPEIGPKKTGVNQLWNWEASKSRCKCGYRRHQVLMYWQPCQFRMIWKKNDLGNNKPKLACKHLTVF